MNQKYFLVFVFLFFHPGQANDSNTCSPSHIEILKEEKLDQVSSLEISRYKLKLQYSQNCFEQQPDLAWVMVARINQSNDLTVSIKERKKGELRSREDSRWNIRINTSYFNKLGRPTLFLQANGENLGAAKTNRGGVFYCYEGLCDIVPSSRYSENESHEVALQATPRLISRGEYISGVHNPNVFDQRIGLALDNQNDLLIFQSDYSSFNVLQRFLLVHLNVREALALDGGSSTSFHSLSIDGDGEVFEINKTHYFWVNVPYYLNFSN